MKRLKWFLIPAMMVILLTIVGTVAAGVKWSGIDPMFELDNHMVNVRIEFPSEFDCSINGPIEVKVKVPTGTDVNFIDESHGNHNGCAQVTSTRFIERDDLKNRFRVKARVNSTEMFPVTGAEVGRRVIPYPSVAL